MTLEGACAVVSFSASNDFGDTQTLFGIWLCVLPSFLLELPPTRAARAFRLCSKSGLVSDRQIAWLLVAAGHPSESRPTQRSWLDGMHGPRNLICGLCLCMQAGKRGAVVSGVVFSFVALWSHGFHLDCCRRCLLAIHHVSLLRGCQKCPTLIGLAQLSAFAITTRRLRRMSASEEPLYHFQHIRFGTLPSHSIHYIRFASSSSD